MKKLKKMFCLILALILVLPFAACSEPDQSKTLMTFHGQKLSTNMFSYMLASPEAYSIAFGDIYLPYAYQNNSDYRSLGSYDNFRYYVQYYSDLRDQLYKDFSESFDKQITDNDGNVTTLGAAYFDALLPYMKRAFVISVLCDEYGLELTDTAVLGDISKEVQGYIDSAGNKDFLDIYLYEKYGASLDIAREYAEKYSLMYMLQSEGGGSDSSYWDNEYKYLNYLLYDYLYGEKGSRRISEEEIKSKFLSDYCIFDYVYYNAYKTVDKNNVLRLDEFIEDDINSVFEENYRKVSYISISIKDSAGKDVKDTAESTANEIYGKLSSGTLEWDSVASSYSGTTAGTYCFASGDSKIDDVVENAVKTLAEGSYAVVTGADSVYVLRGEKLADTDLSGVKSEIITILSKRYFDANYNKMNYILLSFTDGNGEEYSEEKKNEIRALGQEIYGKLQSGECTFTDSGSSSDSKYVKDAYKDAAYTVSVNTTCFAPGELDDGLENKLISMNVGGIATYENEYGYYILNRIEKEESDFTDSAVQLSMTMNYLRVVAEDFESKYKNGEIAFEEAESHDSYAKYDTPNYVDYSQYKDQIKDSYGLEKLGDEKIISGDSYIYITHIRETRDDDYSTFADDITEELNYKDFCSYINGLFSDITVDEDELKLYRNSFNKINVLIIPSLDTVSDDSSSNNSGLEGSS